MLPVLPVLVGLGVLLVLANQGAKPPAPPAPPPPGGGGKGPPGGGSGPGTGAAWCRTLQQGSDAPGCTWSVPPDGAVPPDVAALAHKILFTCSPPLGWTTVVYVDGQPWKFVSETHGPSAEIPTPHHGIGVRTCSQAGPQPVATSDQASVDQILAALLVDAAESAAEGAIA